MQEITPDSEFLAQLDELFTLQDEMLAEGPVSTDDLPQISDLYHPDDPDVDTENLVTNLLAYRHQIEMQVAGQKGIIEALTQKIKMHKDQVARLQMKQEQVEQRIIDQVQQHGKESKSGTRSYVTEQGTKVGSRLSSKTVVTDPSAMPFGSRNYTFSVTLSGIKILEALNNGLVPKSEDEIEYLMTHDAKVKKFITELLSKLQGVVADQPHEEGTVTTAEEFKVHTPSLNKIVKLMGGYQAVQLEGVNQQQTRRITINAGKKADA